METNMMRKCILLEINKKLQHSSNLFFAIMQTMMHVAEFECNKQHNVPQISGCGDFLDAKTTHS